MKLKIFLRNATVRERDEVAAACNGSVGYLYQIAGGHRYASPLMAMCIEEKTRLVANRSNGRLAAVSWVSMVRHPEIFLGIDPGPVIRAEGGDQGDGAGDEHEILYRHAWSV